MAKPAPDESKPKAKRKGAIAAAAKRRRARRVAAPRSNPDGGGGAGLEDAKTIGVGVASYAGTRLVQRMATVIVAKKRPRWRKHIHALAGVVTFGAAYLVGRRVKALDGYHEAVLMGSGIAAVQGLVTAYVPKYAWVLNDVRAEDLQPALPAAASSSQQPVGDEYDYLEQQLEQIDSPPQRRRNSAAATLAHAAQDGDDGIDASVLESLDVGEDLDDLYAGAFENPTLSN